MFLICRFHFLSENSVNDKYSNYYVMFSGNLVAHWSILGLSMNFIKPCVMLIVSSMLLISPKFLLQNSYCSNIIRVPKDFATIQEAVDNAEPGDLVLVSAGTYHEQLRIEKWLTIKGENENTTIIEGNTSGICIQITADNVVVTGFKIQNALIGIVIQNSSGSRIMKNTITAISRESVILLQSQSNIVANNTIVNNAEGIHLVLSSNNTICQNKLYHNFDCGVLLNNSTGNLIKDNSVSANHDTGVFLFDSSNNLVENNVIVWSHDDGIVLKRSRDNLLRGNVVFSNYHSGCYLVNSANNTLVDNVFEANCWHGVELYYSNNNEIANNLGVDNGNVGVYLFCSGGNFLRNNLLTGNARDFRVYGEVLEDFLNDVDCSNRVSGGVLCYWVNKNGLRVPEDVGYVAVINSTGIVVSDLFLSGNGQGVLFAFTNNSFLTRVVVFDNLYGVEFFRANNNRVAFNLLANNTFGIFVRESESNVFCFNTIIDNGKGVVGICVVGNSFFRNNFVNQSEQIAFFQSGGNIWDTGVEGNYWDSYVGVDADGDGVGDAAYVLDGGNCDEYPLMRFRIPGDCNRDGVVDVMDVGIVREAWLSVVGEVCYNSCADLSWDGMVNVGDAVFVGLCWGQSV